MKADLRVFLLATALLPMNADLKSSQPVAGSPTSSDEAGDRPGYIRQEAKRLAIADAKKNAEFNRTGPAKAAPSALDVVKMDPFVVNGLKLPQVVIPKYEAPFMRYLRTGTVLYSPGKVITTKLSTSFSGIHGFAKPEIKLNFSW